MRRRAVRCAAAIAVALTAVAGPVSAAGPAGAADLAGPAGLSSGEAPAPYDITWDDFRSGFAHTGEGAKWALTPTGSLPEGDGRPTTGADGLTVVPTGTDPRTGTPAFVSTTGQEGAGGAGAYDHLKWYAVADHDSSAGFKGFDTVPGQVLTCSTSLSVRTYGTERHPFGARVSDPQSDLRLAAGGLSVIDFETNMVFDFFVTNTRVYAFYERLHRPGAGHAAFSYALPVAQRQPGQRHDLAISYDRAAGTVVWKADGREVLKVDRIGRLPKDRAHLILDHGGTEETVVPRQACSLGSVHAAGRRGAGRRGPGGRVGAAE